MIRSIARALPCASLILLSTSAAAEPRPTPAYCRLLEGVELDRIGIRFEPQTGARVRAGTLVSLTGQDLSVVREAVSAIDGASLAPRFALDEGTLDRMRRDGEGRTLQALPDLNLFGLLTLPHSASESDARDHLKSALALLNSTPGIAEAWALPVAAPATIESETPDFSGLQGYLYAPPSGVWADSAWSFPGGKGEGLKVIGMEWGWLWTHEDLKSPFYLTNDQGPSDHGTATLGMIGAPHNGYGVNGIAPEVQLGGIWLGDIASGILEAVSVLSPGDLYNMSIQVGGPENWMPVEWWPDCFAAIQTGAALGICCMEAAGNGSVDLDAPLYGDAFNPRVRNSGAILCGAGTPNGLDGEWFTNHGERVNLQGWGSSVTTTCCGDLQGGGDPNLYYTSGFSGTSSATPMTCGVMASLQGQAIAAFGVPITPALAEEILSATGTPYNGAKKIGERPNLVAARARLLQGFGDVVVTVRDGDTEIPMPNMVVEIVETGRLAVTGPAGQVAMQLTAGDLTFRVTGDYFYTEAEFPFTVQQGGNQEAILEVHRTPTGSLTGFVRDQDGIPLVGARVQLIHTPLPSVATGDEGNYAIEGIPEAPGYIAIASGISAKGAAHLGFDLSGGVAVPWNPVLVDAETFEAGAAGYSATGEWELGTPTFPNGGNRPIPPSGVNCWGTDLDNTYDNLSISGLTSPTYDLSEATQATLSFHHWMWIESDDGGQVQVWNAAASRWDVVTPIGGYPDDNITILNWGPGFNGHQPTWEPVIVPLDAYAGGDLKIRFYFKSNYVGQGVGWYIDDVALDTGQGTVAVDLGDPAAPGPRVLWAGPNPGAGTSVIRFRLPSPGSATCDVYDLAGARVQRMTLSGLAAGTHEFLWDGRTDRHKPVGSGAYWYRLSAEGRAVTGKLIRLR